MNDEKKNASDGPAHDTESQGKSPMTRREWLQGVSGAALAAGLPAMAASASENASLGHADAAPDGLPPGLYAPSQEHLGRALENDSLFHVIPSGSETDYARPVTGEFEPLFFSQNAFSVIRRLVSVLLGLPDAPEGSSAGEAGEENVIEATAQFIDLRVSEVRSVSDALRALSPQHKTLAMCYYGADAVESDETSNPEKICREGLAWLDEVSLRKHGAKFLELATPQQVEIVKVMSDEEADATRQNEGTRFSHLLKDETIRGYYTSRVGLRELDDKRNSFHVVSPGCPDKRIPVTIRSR